MKDIEWLRGLCNNNDPRPGNLLTQPWSIEHKGITWNFATQGHVMVAVRGDAAFPPSPNQGSGGPRLVLAYPSPERTVSLASLRAFAGAPQQETCSACRGCGKDVCEECERPFPYLTCEACDGTSKQWVNETIVVHGKMFNRHLLARALEHLTEPAIVRIGASDPPMLLVESNEWRV